MSLLAAMFIQFAGFGDVIPRIFWHGPARHGTPCRPAAPGSKKTVSSSISGVVGTLGYKAIASRALWYLYFLTCFLFLYWPVNVTLLFVGIIVRRNRLGR